MTTLRTVAIADPQDESRAALRDLLSRLDTVWLAAECTKYEFCADAVQQSNADLAIVSLDDDAEAGLALVEGLSAADPSPSVLVVSSHSESQLILRAMRAGAKEFLTMPVAFEELVAALDRLCGGRGATGDSGARSSKVISFVGGSGGVGTTTLAVNVGCALAQDAQCNVVLIDLDPTLGDAQACLDVMPEYTLADVAANLSRLDFTLLKRSLTKHDSGLFLLPHSLDMRASTTIDGEQLRRVLSLLKATFSHILIDTSKTLTPTDWAGLEASDSILLVTQLDLHCLRNAVRLLVGCSQHEGLADKMKVVLNRIGFQHGDISIGKAEKLIETLGRDIYWEIPNDWQAMMTARNEGVPLVLHAPKAKISKSICQLAESLFGSNGLVPEKPKKRRFSFFGK